MARNKVYLDFQISFFFPFKGSNQRCHLSCLKFGNRSIFSREALVLLLDVGPSMHNLLPEIEKVCSMLVQKKLIYNKSDEVGIVLFGSEDTDNALTKEVGGYEHVVVLRHIKVIDGDMVDALQKLPRGTACGDFLDAIVVGMDMLIKKFGPTNKGKQRLCLITNAQYPTKEPFEGTKEDQIDTISAQMKTHGMRLDCIIVRGKLTGAANKKIMDENDLLLNRFSKKTISKSVYVESPTSLYGALRTRNISPVTIFRGDLELSPSMKIKVWVYKKTSEEKFPTLKRYSDKAPSNDRFATHEVKVDIEYKSLENPNKVVPPEQRIKGYRYGPQVVPISSAEWEAVKFKPEKSVKLLGFTDASNVMRHYYMKDVNVFIPEPGNAKAILAVSSLVRAMKEMNKVAILRCVWRQGQGSVVIGVLTPNISSLDNIPDSFYFNVLPFAEDVREFQFPSFNNFPPSWQPNEQQQEAADNFVRMLDLAPSGKEEALQPDFTPNPVLERFYHFLELKSKQPDADVPPLDRTLKRVAEPDPELLSQNQSVIANFRNKFELKENPKKKKSSRLLWREKRSASDEGEKDAEDVPDVQSVKLIGNSSKMKVEEIGDLNPVQDFEAMMARRDSSEWVSKAIRNMKVLISDLLDSSCEGNHYDKAMECLVALRRGCILEQEPKEFNQFMQELSKKCKEKNLKRFWELLISKHVTLISKEEAIDSDVADNEAKRFLVKTELTSE
ncbi:ATP-dependent DNA helicase 2 subunit KU80 isoform X2 [Magnolia sinica]|uniref:ATP-dependent DNA helicase 2 subunit KU80 isoform X2 n=1 Tax=Magnolia sinica TaxID=86752 RepID=UPI00265AB57E|nr:ATP-dependent DNA helicase 2 subunit KU80 isoform X2 [Magnolia sinica]